MTIEYGDPRVPDSFWDKVHTIPETDCWGWTGAHKKVQEGDGRGRAIALVHPSRQKVTTLLIYMAEKFHGLDRNTHKALRTCDDIGCANPNHVRVFLKGQCVIDPENHGTDRYRNGQCKACRAKVDAARPRDSKAAMARAYRARLKAEGTERTDVARKKLNTVSVSARGKAQTLKQRREAAGLTVFGDKPPEKKWRPAGWSAEPNTASRSA
jgi:hypothetical protein